MAKAPTGEHPKVPASAVEDEGREQFIAAGVAHYFDLKTTFAEAGEPAAFDEDLVFNDSRFTALPGDVQAGIREGVEGEKARRAASPAETATPESGAAGVPIEQRGPRQKSLEELKGKELALALRNTTTTELREAIGRASGAQANRVAETLLAIDEETLPETLRGGARKAFAAEALEVAWNKGLKQEQDLKAAERIARLYLDAGETRGAQDFVSSLAAEHKATAQRLWLLVPKPAGARKETPPPSPGKTVLEDVEDALDADAAAPEAETTGEAEEGLGDDDEDKVEGAMAWDPDKVKEILKEGGLDVDHIEVGAYVKKERRAIEERIREMEREIRGADAKTCSRILDTLGETLTGDYFGEEGKLEKDQISAEKLVSLGDLKWTFKDDAEELAYERFFTKNVKPLLEFLEELTEHFHTEKLRLEDLAKRTGQRAEIKKVRKPAGKGGKGDKTGGKEVKGKDETAAAVETLVNRFKKEAKEPLSYAIANGESYFYTSLLEEEVDVKTASEEELPIIRGVISALAKEQGIDEKALTEEVAAVVKERTEEGDKFRYRAQKKKTLGWVKEADLPELLRKLNVKPKDQKQFFACADFLEAARRCLSKVVDVRRASERTERLRIAREEEDARAERLSRGWLKSRGKFLALAYLSKSKGEDAIKELIAKPEGEQDQAVKDLLRQALTDKGFSVPAGSDYNVGQGTAFARSLDRLELKRQRKGDKKEVAEVHYGYVVGELPDGTLDFQFVSRKTRELIGREPVTLTTEQYRDLRKAIPASVDGRAGLELFDLAGVGVRIRANARELEQGGQNVELVRAGQLKKGTIAVNTGHFDGVGFDGLYEYDEKGRRKVFGNEAVFEEFKRLEAAGKLEEFDWKKVKPEELTLIIDHHGSTSTKESAASAYALEFLDASGLLDKYAPAESEKRKALDRAMQFIRHDDNKTHPNWGENWEKDSPRTILGLARHLTLKKLIEFYETHPEDGAETAPLSEAELEKYVDREHIERQKMTVVRAKDDLQRLKDSGYVIEGTRLGSLIVLPPVGIPTNKKDEDGRRVWNYRQRHLAGGIDAVRSLLGKDAALLYWDPINGRAFLSSTGKPLNLPREVTRQGMELRQTMFIVDPERHKLKATLAEFLDGAAAPEDGEVAVTGKLKRYVDEIERIQIRYAQRKEEVRIKDGKDLEQMTPKEWKGPIQLTIEKRGSRSWVSMSEELRGPDRRVLILGPDRTKITPDQIDGKRLYQLKLVEIYKKTAEEKGALYILTLEDLDGVEKAPDVIDPKVDLGLTDAQIEALRSAVRGKLLEATAKMLLDHYTAAGRTDVTQRMVEIEARNRVTTERTEKALQGQYRKKWEQNRDQGRAKPA